MSCTPNPLPVGPFFGTSQEEYEAGEMAEEDARARGSWVTCDDCGGEGLLGHDCGEDCCACADPDDNMPCLRCEGRGGWHQTAAGAAAIGAALPKGE